LKFTETHPLPVQAITRVDRKMEEVGNEAVTAH